MKKNLCFGFIGAGYISNAHALALNSAAKIMDIDADISFGAICSDIPAEAERFARRFNCRKICKDWRALIDDPAVNAVVIGTPPYLHFEQAKAAILAGKHIICEKPITMSLRECTHLCELAEKQGVRHAVGLTYLANPAIFMAKELLAGNKLGRLYGFTAYFNEDHLSDPDLPFHWHCDEKIAGSGTTADLGYHVAGYLLSLLGMPESLIANREIKVPQRRVSSASGTRSINAAAGDDTARQTEKRGGKNDPQMKRVTSDDMANAIIRYDEDLAGVIQVSRVATGRDQFIWIEINGSLGSLLIDMEDMNTIQLYLRQDDRQQEGFKRIFIGPQHQYFSKFCPAPAHGLGFNDLLIIQDGCFAESIVTGRDRVIADLHFGKGVQSITDAMVQSADSNSWVYISGK